VCSTWRLASLAVWTVAKANLPPCPLVVLIMTGRRKGSILVMPAELAISPRLSHDGEGYRPVRIAVQRQKIALRLRQNWLDTAGVLETMAAHAYSSGRWLK